MFIVRSASQSLHPEGVTPEGLPRRGYMFIVRSASLSPTPKGWHLYFDRKAGLKPSQNGLRKSFRSDATNMSPLRGG